MISGFNDQSLNNFSTFNNRQSNIQLWQFIKDLLNNPTQHKGKILGFFTLFIFNPNNVMNFNLRSHSLD